MLVEGAVDVTPEGMSEYLQRHSSVKVNTGPYGPRIRLNRIALAR
jgi:hypothetical protein